MVVKKTIKKIKEKFKRRREADFVVIAKPGESAQDVARRALEEIRKAPARRPGEEARIIGELPKPVERAVTTPTGRGGRRADVVVVTPPSGEFTSELARMAIEEAAKPPLPSGEARIVGQLPTGRLEEKPRARPLQRLEQLRRETTERIRKSQERRTAQFEMKKQEITRGIGAKIGTFQRFEDQPGRAVETPFGLAKPTKTQGVFLLPETQASQVGGTPFTRVRIKETERELTEEEKQQFDRQRQEIEKTEEGTKFTITTSSGEQVEVSKKQALRIIESDIELTKRQFEATPVEAKELTEVKEFVSFTERRAAEGSVLATITRDIAPRFTPKDPFGLRTIAVTAVGLARGKGKEEIGAEIQKINVEALGQISEQFGLTSGQFRPVSGITRFTVTSPVAQTGAIIAGGQFVAAPAIRGAGAGIRALPGGAKALAAGKTALGITIGGKVTVGTIATTTAVGGLEALKVTKQVRAGVPGEVIFAGVGKDIIQITAFGAGVKAGLKPTAKTLDVKIADKAIKAQILQEKEIAFRTQQPRSFTISRGKFQKFQDPFSGLKGFKGIQAGKTLTITPEGKVFSTESLGKLKLSKTGKFGTVEIVTRTRQVSQIAVGERGAFTFKTTGKPITGRFELLTTTQRSPLFAREEKVFETGLFGEFAKTKGLGGVQFGKPTAVNQVSLSKTVAEQRIADVITKKSVALSFAKPSGIDKSLALTEIKLTPTVSGKVIFKRPPVTVAPTGTQKFIVGDVLRGGNLQSQLKIKAISITGKSVQAAQVATGKAVESQVAKLIPKAKAAQVGIVSLTAQQPIGKIFAKEAAPTQVLKAAPKEKAITIFGQREKPLTGVSQKAEETTKILTKQTTGFSSKAAQTAKQAQGVLQKQGLLQQQAQAVRERTALQQVISPVVAPAIGVPKFGIAGILPGIDLEPEAAQAPKEEGYHVEVRRRGEFVRVNKNPLTKSDAAKLGSIVVDQASPRSFRIKRSATPASDDRVSGMSRIFKFTKGKKEPINFVERSKFAIDSPGEDKEITKEGLKTLARERIISKVKAAPKSRSLFSSGGKSKLFNAKGISSLIGKRR